MNKKRLGKFIAVSSVFVISSVTGAILAGCDGCHTHEHQLTEVSAVDPTCTTNGRYAYYVCGDCEMMFSDAEGENVITLQDTIIEKLGHDLEHHKAEDATCTQPGNIEYWECTRGDGLFSDEEGKNPVTTVETTKDHNWGTTGHHEQVDPTTESEGTKEYWHCSDCGFDYADANGDQKVTPEELKIDKVNENIDGKLTTDFYNTDNALVIGGSDVLDGGMGLVINAVRANDGVYLHVVVNYDIEATKQPAGKGKIGIYFNVRNSDNLNLPGGAGDCLAQSMLMELYLLEGKIDYHKPYSLIKFNTTENEDSLTKYTTTWEMFIPHSGFATVNNGVFAEAFETVDGKTALKSGYTYMITAIGAFDPEETFENYGDSLCDPKDDDGDWAFWNNKGHGDWNSDQKYYVLGAQGITENFQRASDTYGVTVNEYANATVTGLIDTVNYDENLEGTVTVDEGYRLSGIKVNGQVFTFVDSNEDNVYEYEIAVSDLTNLKWNETELTVEFVITKLDYQTVEITVQGKAGGKTQDIAQGTYVTIVSEFGDEYTEQVGEDGKVQFNNVLCQDYTVKIDNYIDGLLTVSIGEQTTEVYMEYHFAHNVGTRPDLVDLTDMNAENASITLGGQNVNGVDQDVISVQLNLSDEMKNAQAYVLYTTVTVNGDVSQSKQNTWYQRFAIRFAKGDSENTYNNKFVIWWDDLGLNARPSAIWAKDDTSCGGSTDRAAADEWLQSSVLDGLQLKVVRNGSFVTVSALNLDDEKWYTILSGTTSADAENDITFFVSGESFTFSEISYEQLIIDSLVLPVGDADGVKGHLTASNGDVFTLSGIITSEEELAIPADSIAFTDYDDVNIESEDGVITIDGNGIDDRENHSTTYATYILPESVRGEKEISLTLNVKDTYSPEGGDNFAARRFGIQIGEGEYGLYFWTPYNTEFNINKFVNGTLDMNTDKDGQGVSNAHWAAPIIRSENGLDLQIVRIGNKIILNLKNADGEWVNVGEIDCPETAETEIKFVGGGDNWKVSEIAAGALQKVTATAATHEDDGNIEYYTDGVNYYLPDGSVTTKHAVTIPQIVEKEVEITVEVYGTDGNKIEADLSNVKVTLTGEYDYNKNVYTELEVSEGVLVLTDGKIYEGKYSVTVNGYAAGTIEIDDETSAITLNLYQISSYQIVDVEKTGDVSVKLSTNGATVSLTGKGFDNDNYGASWVSVAELGLPDAVKNSKNVILSFNIKLTNQNGGEYDWAARRFGVTIEGANGGFMCFTPKDEEASLYVMGNRPADEADKIECKDLAALLRSDSGAQFRVVRNGDSVIIYLQLDDEMVKLGTYPCSAEGETKVVFYGIGDTWIFSDLAVYSAPAAFTTPEGSVRVSADIERHEYVAPSVSNDYVGNVEYYTVGDNYYLADGTKTTADGVKIAEVEVSVTVNAVDREGNTVELEEGAEIALAGANKDYTFTVGGTGGTLDKMIPGEYEAYLYGYGVATVKVGNAGGNVTIALVGTIAYATVGTHGGNSGVTIDDENNKITITGNGLVDNNATWAGSAEIVISEELKNSKNVAFTFTLKDTYLHNGGWDWAARRFAITMQGTYGGIMGFTPQNDEASLYLMDANLEAKNGEVPFNKLAELIRSEDGINMQVIRIDSVIVVNAEIDEVWVRVGEFACNGEGDTKIVIYGEGDTFEFSNINVYEYSPKTITVDKKNDIPDDVELAVNELKEGYSLTGTVSSETYTEFAILVNGKCVAVVEAGDFTIEWPALGVGDGTQITLGLYVTKTTAEAASPQACPTGNINLDGESLDGKTILGYARYNSDDLGGYKYSGEVVGNELDGHSRFGDDYDGTREGTTFTADGITNGGCAYFNPGQYYNVTLHVSKGTTKIRLYTGTYATGKLEYILSENGIKLAELTFDKSEGRAYIVDIEIDTSLWADGESRDLTLRIGGEVDCELAAIVLLGSSVTETE